MAQKRKNSVRKNLNRSVKQRRRSKQNNMDGTLKNLKTFFENFLKNPINQLNTVKKIFKSEFPDLSETKLTKYAQNFILRQWYEAEVSKELNYEELKDYLQKFVVTFKILDFSTTNMMNTVKLSQYLILPKVDKYDVVDKYIDVNEIIFPDCLETIDDYSFTPLKI